MVKTLNLFAFVVVTIGAILIKILLFIFALCFVSLKFGELAGYLFFFISLFYFNSNKPTK